MSVPLIIALFAFSFKPVESNKLSLDQISAGIISHASQQGPRVLLHVFDPLPKLYIFDFKTSKVQHLDDGRLPRIIMAIVPYDEGFAIFEGSRFRPMRLFFLDQKGKLLRSEQISDRPALSKVTLTHVSSYKDKVLVTYESLEFKDQICLGHLDLEAMELTKLASLGKDEQQPKVFWAAAGDSVYFVSPYRALLTQTTASYEQGPPLTQAEPLELSRSGQSMANTQTNSLLKYRPLLSSFIQLNDTISFTRISKTEETVTRFILGQKVVAPKMNYSYFLLSKNTIEQTAKKVVAQHGHKTLVFDNREETFSIISTPKSEPSK